MPGASTKDVNSLSDSDYHQVKELSQYQSATNWDSEYSENSSIVPVFGSKGNNNIYGNK